MEAPLLKKYKLKNIAKGQTHLVTGLLGDIYIPLMTDEQAEALYKNGSRRFIGKVAAAASSSGQQSGEEAKKTE